LTVLMWRAGAARDDRRFEDECALTTQALEVARGIYSTMAETAWMLNRHACALRSVGRVEEAVAALDEALELCRRVDAADSINYAQLLNNAAIMHWIARDVPAALRFLDESIAMRVRLAQSPGDAAFAKAVTLREEMRTTDVGDIANATRIRAFTRERDDEKEA